MLLPIDSTFSRCSLIQICFEFICSVIFLYVLSRSKDIRLCTFIHWDDKCAPFRCSKTCQGCHYQMHFKCFQQWFFCLHVSWLVYVLLGPLFFFLLFHLEYIVKIYIKLESNMVSFQVMITLNMLSQAVKWKLKFSGSLLPVRKETCWCFSSNDLIFIVRCNTMNVIITLKFLY